MGRFDGKVAIVSGAGSGIGRAVGLRLAMDGATVVVTDIDVSSAEQTVALIDEAGGLAVALQQDVARPEEHQRVVASVTEQFGGLHLAVNNAGIGGTKVPVGEMAIADWDQVIAINLNGVAYALRYQIPAIIAAGGGAIVNLSSIAGSVALPACPAYTAAKHGVIGLTKSAGADYGAAGVRINAVGPGYIGTPRIKQLPEDVRADMGSKHALGRLGADHEVANLIAFLLSDEASFITGSYHLVDGGYTAV